MKVESKSAAAATSRSRPLDRYAGALVGLACGDAVGTSVEFRARGHFEPVTDMRGGGPFSLEPGQWTDDTSMALCLAESLLETGRFDARDQMERYVRWWRRGHWSATGDCFDIGTTVRGALARFQSTGDPFAGSTDPDTAGNGALMRLAPVVLFFHPGREQALHFAVESSRTTHSAGEALDCARLLAHVLFEALEGGSKDAILDGTSLPLASSKVAAIAARAYRDKSEAQVFGTGYCVASLEAALWCFAATDSFESAVLRATNLGDDADTTAAITGQIAGAWYGLAGIPERWRTLLHRGDEIEAIARRLGAQRSIVVDRAN